MPRPLLIASSPFSGVGPPPAEADLARALRTTATAQAFPAVWNGRDFIATSSHHRARPWTGGGVHDRGAAFEALRNWLLDGRSIAARGRRPPDRPARPWSLAHIAEKRLDAPPGAVLLTIGWRIWSDANFVRLVGSRSDLHIVAALTPPWEIDFPEFGAPGDALAARSAQQALQARAHRILDLDSAQLLAVRASRLGSTAPAPFDAALAAHPYFVQVGPIESRSNALLLLQVWRDLAQWVIPTPKLVLVGPLGGQIADVAPMLDWCFAIEPLVRLAASLDRTSLRRLIAHSRGLLAPDFVGADFALLRDALQLGVPAFVGRTPMLAFEGLQHIEPIAGLSWRRAVLEAAKRPPRQAHDEAILPSLECYREAVLAGLADL
jgi:hypothetical protein